MKKKVVVFGGSGFIGSYLVKELLTRGHQVLVADMKQNQYNKGAEFQFCDILIPDQVAAVLTGDIDFVYNLAGFANIDLASDSPVETFKLNVIGNLNILEVIKNINISRYIYSSSAYAMNDKGSFYGISKLSSEKIIEEYNKKYDVNYTILRFGSIYSELDFDNNYIYKIVKDIVTKRKIAHEGDGNEIREYIHAADSAIMAADVIESADYVNQYMILTGVESIRRKDLFEMIEEILGEPFDIDYKNTGYKNHYKLTPYSFQPTISRKMIAKSYIDIGQGILECIKNVNKYLHEK